MEKIFRPTNEDRDNDREQKFQKALEIARKEQMQQLSINGFSDEEGFEKFKIEARNELDQKPFENSGE
jgi:hypothetical protein